MTEQTVTTETDVESVTSTEESGAQDDLDKLLADFDEETSSQSEQSDQGSEQPTTSLDDEDKQFLQSLKEQETERQINEEIDRMSEHVPEDVTIPNDVLRAMVEYKAAKNPKIADAFMKRHQNPEAWGKVSKSLVSEISKGFQKQPDKKSTQDREAVIAAVQSASTSSQEESQPDFSKMNDAQYQKWKRENL
jgi:hypothetical protein